MLNIYKQSFFGFLWLFVVLLEVSSAEEDANGVISKDRASLLSFMAGIVSHSERALDKWNASGIHVCEWSGIQCHNVSRAVVKLDLSGRSLRGTISPALSGMSSLAVLDLSRNFFEGQIPPEIGSVVGLKLLSLAWNLLEGEIPSELGSLRQLIYIDLGSNRLSDNIPSELFCNWSNSIQYIDLSNNTLTGKLPLRDECKLKELKYLLLWSNRLTGQVPPALGNSSKLKWLDLESNFLTGELPLDILRKMPYLQFLYLSYNGFTSHDGNTNLEPFFDALANFSHLQELELGANNLGGVIPLNIGDLPKNLSQLHLAENHIYGTIPTQISNLTSLTLLNLSSNLLNGTIPIELCQMERLERVYLSNNSLSGELPSALGDLPHLGLLDLSRNQLSGSIPDSFANLSQLRRLFLYKNNLSGTIPPSLGKCVNLEILDLSHNQISGLLPGEVAGLRSLKLYLNLSSNHLQGAIPLELSKMDMVLAIDLSLNNLSGKIPSQLGSCIALEHLNLSSNILEGPLPSSIGQLPYLKSLDVSSNHLAGALPLSLQASPTLRQFNVSFNNFSGNVSSKGGFSTLTLESFLGNPELCGSIKDMRPCPRKKRHGHVLILSILLSLVAMPLFCIFGYPALTLKTRIKRQLSIFHEDNNSGDEEQGRKGFKSKRYYYLPKISHRQLLEATGGFRQSSLIGSGRFGQVYKGVLQDETRIAVKVLDPRLADISESFKRECQVLRRTRHRNLMRIITICSKPDFKALVLPLMPNGSLENHLYSPTGGPTSGPLHLTQLVSILSDVAEGVAYLHHHSPVRVVHCDLKPSNILLDEDLTALVTDFGISRLVKNSDDQSNNVYNSAYDSVSCSSTDGLLCGSVGYIAPEYGMGKRASPEGDVFSFGVLVLEIITGIRPTNVPFSGGSSLHEWVKSHYPYNLDPIIEEALARHRCPGIQSEPLNELWREIVVELIELGLMCTQYNPSTRPNMSDVALEMGRLKQYLSSPSEVMILEASTTKS
ncbi:putative leucine-rich repeat receptor-like serine/threonine-protein kinase At2g24130 [Punica granatum]|uniref:non-specific serine/threonine protein kinase n=2 Tax=Punica granatum TaxID=22663 RepID=A0A218XZG4_PUNGR|nr:putative leucine-rich repeat receptor-like serine/threonine-protein kinase At2g24130 [Punica granatum]OWM89989.1 hypothetical protein CDL15_Pgr012626 [Punica granatum]PKI70208.1 hypothetical protein CRG98_009400 [Punica granatum]